MASGNGSAQVETASRNSSVPVTTSGKGSIPTGAAAEDSEGADEGGLCLLTSEDLAFEETMLPPPADSSHSAPERSAPKRAPRLRLPGKGCSLAASSG
mmetsp:Transcript_26653/g.44661  ORF Transcript_26653/g.44661 Transcript_26653/m.44661 type:complete len:98 (-) Transcript_26653:112-405(-)